MYKFLLTLTAFAFISVSAASCCKNSETNSMHNSQSGEAYSCPMHPEQRSENPGTCSICGMDYVKK